MRRRLQAVVLAAVVVLACERKHKTLVSKEGCEPPEVVHCLQDYAYEELTSEDIRKLSKEGIPKCYSKEETFRMVGQFLTAGCFGLEVGKDKRGGAIWLTYRCAEDCGPEMAEVLLGYATKVDLETCCAMGGYPTVQGGYTGDVHYGFCSPPEAVSEDELPSPLCSHQE